MNIEQKDTYFVAVKIFLMNFVETQDFASLLILKDNFGDWDLPGGRIKKDEFDVPFEQIIKRKMIEELGDKIKYTIIKPAVFMRYERIEATPGNPLVRIFAIGYSGTLDSGEIILSSRHTEMKWVNLKIFKPEEYFKGGWLKGVKEYIDFVKQ
ncbi:NUDIX domain-containing protein [Candidatus Kuenenbacteria bacterium]|nr:NUDIX domain-containing protein [Candidatus Kuenenbacteria bacterium]